MNKFEQADKDLAELLGWTEIQPYTCFGITPQGNSCGAMPRWTQDDGEAFRLAVEYEIEIIFIDNSTVQCIYFSNKNIGYHSTEELFVDYPDAVSCVRFAIVQAVIAKLKG